jgi:hypothetical protein
MFGKAFVKQGRRITVIATVLCVAMANAGVLYAVHMHQHSTSHSAGSHHDPSTCPFCIQFASGNKVVSPDFGEPISLTVDPVQDVVSFHASFLPSMSLRFSPARAPPTVS